MVQPTVWELDYVAAKLVLHQTPPAHDYALTVPLGFPETNGQRTGNFPRIEATVDGEQHDLLFDTGAHTHVTREAATQIAGQGLRRATSFIIDSIAHRWHEQHPDWPVIHNGEAGTGADMIQVPSVKVGGLDTGPVWFTQRRDTNFLDYMSQWMDKTVVGALGGNVLRGFRILLDYPAASVSLHRQHQPGEDHIAGRRHPQPHERRPLPAFGAVAPRPARIHDWRTDCLRLSGVFSTLRSPLTVGLPSSGIACASRTAARWTITTSLQRAHLRSWHSLKVSK